MLRFIVLLVVCSFSVGLNPYLGMANNLDLAIGPDTLVLCPPKFQRALQPWIDYRTGQGHAISVVAPKLSSLGIKSQILETAQSGTLKNVVIVGDVGDHRVPRELRVATDYIAARVNVHFGSEPEIATDNTYADLDNDGIPDLTIGRMPVDNVAEIDQMTNRIIEYESQTGNPEWKRRINFIAGVGGFGQVIDGIIENTTKQIITDLVPGSYQTSMTYGSWNSPYCPDPRRFSESTIQRFNEGCLFWVYIGHGSRHRLDRVHMPDRSYLILDNASLPKLSCESGSPIAIFLACYTGAMDDPIDCLAETMLRQKNGPIATICGSRVTMPYAMSLLSLEMLHEYFEGDAETVGELLTVAKRKMVTGSTNHREYREMIEGMGKTFSPAPRLLKQERYEHVQLIHLLGDPLLRLRRPQKVQLEAPELSATGNGLQIRGEVPADGKLTLEVAYQRDRMRQRRPSRRQFDPSHQALAEYQTTYDQSRELVCASETILVVKGPFESVLKIPESASGRCVVRAMLVSENGLSLGSNPVDIKKPIEIMSAEKTEDSLKKSEQEIKR